MADTAGVAPLQPMVGAEERLFLYTAGTTPVLTEIPVSLLKPNRTKQKETIWTSANVVIVNGQPVVYGQTISTAIDEELEVKTQHFRNGNTTETMLDSLQSIQAAGDETSPGDYLQFVVVMPGRLPYLATYQVDPVDIGTGNVEKVVEFDWKMKLAGPWSVYATALPARPSTWN